MFLNSREIKRISGRLDMPRLNTLFSSKGEDNEFNQWSQAILEMIVEIPSICSAWNFPNMKF